MTSQDPQILGRIGRLVEEENDLRSRHQGTRLDDAELDRLMDIEAELDQCWDVLNQRRARREFGMDADEARVRDENTVEGYQQ